MIEMRIQVEEMHVYYFIAKKLISNAKLGFMGIMAGPEERLLNNIYNSWNLDDIDSLTKKLFDKLDKVQTKIKINENPQNLKDTEELISLAVSYTADLLFKPEVLDRTKKALKPELSKLDKVILCIDKICQTKRVLMGLSPEARKRVLDGKDIEVSSNPQKKEFAVVPAVDEENVTNMTEVESNVSRPNIDISEIPLDEEVVEAFDDDVDEGNRLRNVFTAEDMPIEPIEHYVNGVELTREETLISPKKQEEIEILDFEEDEVVSVIDEKNIRDEIIIVSDRKFNVVEEKEIEAVSSNVTEEVL